MWRHRDISLLRNTLVTLIPKTRNVKCMKDLRPTCCCTNVYKIISKILAIRLSSMISLVVDVSNSAFIPRRTIQDNILMEQELVKGYGREHISPRYLIQMDLQKAYDTGCARGNIEGNRIS